MEDLFNSDWRKITAAIYQKPRDSKILGSIELDVTELEQFIQEKRQQKLKITLTHVMLLLLARAIHQDVPALNCYVRRGRIIPRKAVDVSVTVMGLQGGLSSVKVFGAERHTLGTLTEALQQEVADARKGKGAHVKKARNLLSVLPWPFRQWVVNLVRWITIDLSIPLPFIGVHPDSFGTFVLSNIGSIGLDVGYPALAPFSNVAMVVTQGNPSSKPAVHEGQITIRRIMTVSAAVDHRVVDAGHMGQLFMSLRKQIKHPEWLDNPPHYGSG